MICVFLLFLWRNYYLLLFGCYCRAQNGVAFFSYFCPLIWYLEFFVCFDFCTIFLSVSDHISFFYRVPLLLIISPLHDIFPFFFHSLYFYFAFSCIMLLFVLLMLLAYPYFLNYEGDWNNLKLKSRSEISLNLGTEESLFLNVNKKLVQS